MEAIKMSRKELKELINSSFQESLVKLQLPLPSKKIKRLLSKNSKKLAVVFSGLIKRESKRKENEEKTLTYVEDVLKGKEKVKQNKVPKLN